MTASDHLREARERWSMTQSDLAQKLGTTHQAVSFWEKKNLVSPKYGPIISQLLGLSFSNQIREARLALNWSAKVLAERSGYSTLLVHKLENDPERTSPSIPTMIGLAQATGCAWEIGPWSFPVQVGEKWARADRRRPPLEPMDYESPLSLRDQFQRRRAELEWSTLEMSKRLEVSRVTVNNLLKGRVAIGYRTLYRAAKVMDTTWRVG